MQDIPSTMSDNTSSGFRLVVGPHSFVARHMHHLTVDYALKGPLRLLICGNYLDLSGLSYDLARQTQRYYDILENDIMLSRAETCYQVAGVLQRLEASSMPTLITDLLTGFYDEGVHDHEVDDLLFETIQALRRLSRAGAVVVSSSPDAKRSRLFNALMQAAGMVERPQAAAITHTQ